MKRYEVMLGFNVTFGTTLEIEADSPEAACKIAMDTWDENDSEPQEAIGDPGPTFVCSIDGEPAKVPHEFSEDGLDEPEDPPHSRERCP